MITEAEIRDRYPHLYAVMEAMAADSDLWVFSRGPAFESDRVQLRPDANELSRYRDEHNLVNNWMPPSEVSLDELELLASKLSGYEVEEFAAGEHTENVERTNRLGLYVLDIFLEECFDGSLAKAFRGEPRPLRKAK